MKRFFEGVRRLPAYLAVLRPCFFIALIIVYLPLTASCDKIWGNSLLANLFVEYGFWKAFWFGFPLFGAVWALCLPRVSCWTSRAIARSVSNIQSNAGSSTPANRSAPLRCRLSA